MVSPPSTGCFALLSNPRSQIYLSSRGHLETRPQAWIANCDVPFTVLNFLCGFSIHEFLSSFATVWSIFFLCCQVEEPWSREEKISFHILPIRSLAKVFPEAAGWRPNPVLRSHVHNEHLQMRSQCVAPATLDTEWRAIPALDCALRAHHVLGPDSPSAGKQHISHSLVLLHPPQHQF